RAIARSRIPVISGVGHETDFTIADFVADYRASTPTAAATAAVPDIADWQSDLQAKQFELTELMEAYLEDMAEKVERTQRDLQRANPSDLLDRRRQQLDDTAEFLQMRLQHILSLRVERLSGMALRLHALSPLITIARGYAVVRRNSDSALVTSIQQVQPGDALTIQVTDGSIPVEVRRT
ncbi:MAG TPA: exodeoxyribonuclease VII large subunit, partial [Ktedonobacter sp.]|nr:exodeoxyribonuclease VII large subunit [Ktedonobacter sp.]